MNITENIYLSFTLYLSVLCSILLPNLTFSSLSLSFSLCTLPEPTMASTPSSSAAINNNKDGKTSENEIGSGENVLKKHVAFFDRNHDGIIYPWETYQGFRAIGCGFPLSAFGAIFINFGLSRKTRPGKFPSLLYPIEVKNIQKAKHGSDSGVYDSEGRFVPSKFEEIFTKHARENPNALTGDELKVMLKANRELKDYTGWVGGFVEWMVLYYLCKDKNGLLHKETIRAVYDGSLFEQMERDHSQNKTK